MEKEELELTCTEYCTPFPFELVDAFHCSCIPQDPEQLPFGSAINTGTVGPLAGGGVDDRAKDPAVDQAETIVVLTESRACTRQYQVPVPKVGVQLVPEIHPDE